MSAAQQIDAMRGALTILLAKAERLYVTYKLAYDMAKFEAGCRFEEAEVEADIAAAEADHRMSDRDREEFIQAHLEGYLGESDYDMFVEDELERFMYQYDQPVIEGVYEGVAYKIGWRGGSPLLWVVHGPLGQCNQLCSPCVPNAGDLDSGFTTANDVWSGNRFTAPAKPDRPEAPLSAMERFNAKLLAQPETPAVREPLSPAQLDEMWKKARFWQDGAWRKLARMVEEAHGIQVKS